MQRSPSRVSLVARLLASSLVAKPSAASFGRSSLIAALCSILPAPASAEITLNPPPGYKVITLPFTQENVAFSAGDANNRSVCLPEVVVTDVKRATAYYLDFDGFNGVSGGWNDHYPHPLENRDAKSYFGQVRYAPYGSHYIGMTGRDTVNLNCEQWAANHVKAKKVRAIVPESALELRIARPGADGDDVEVGAEFEIRVSIQALADNGGPVSNITWDALLALPDDMVEIVSGPEPEGIPESFSLAPGETLERSYILKGLRPGSLELSTDATGTSALGFQVNEQPATLDVELHLDLLDVEVEIEKALIELERDDGDEPIPQEFEATVKVTNVFDEPIELVKIDTFDPESLKVPPPFPLALTVVEGPIDPAGLDQTPATLGTIQPGQTITRKYTLEASNNGHYDVLAVVSGKDPFSEAGFSEHDKTEVKISDQVILHFDASRENVFQIGATDWVLGGNSWRIVGTVENRSEDETILVLLQPDRTGNASYAQPIPVGTDAPDAKCAMGIAKELPPGESMDFVAPVRTIENGGTRGIVKFEPKGYILEDDGKKTPLTEDQVFYEKGSTEHIVHVDTSTDPPIDPSVDLLIGHYLVGTVDGLGTLLESVPAIFAMAGHGLKHALSFWNYPKLYRAAGDKLSKYLIDLHAGLSPADRAAYDESVVSAVALSLGMSLTGARDLVDRAVEDRFTKLTTAWNSGDSAAVAQWWGELSGENPDLVIQALVAGYGLCKLGYKGSLAAERALKGVEATQAATLEARAAQGAKALRAADVLNYEIHLSKIFGIDKVSHRMLLDLAEKWNIMIVVRRRGAGVIDKLKTGRFRLKPYDVKAKNVIPIDSDWLGFPAAHLDEVMIKEPPPWAEVKAKMDASAQDPELIAEVQERWTARWEEWHGKGADPVTGAGGEIAKSERYKWLQYQEDGIKVGKNSVAGVEGNIEAGFSIPKDDTLTVKRNFRGDLKAGSDGRPCFLAKIEDPIKGWQGVTGDVDALAFLRPDGTLLPPAVRLKLYKALRHLGFEHPESLTWENAAGRNNYIKEFSLHNPNSEAAACYRPNRTVVATRFDPGKSWIDPIKWKTAAMMFFRGASMNLASEEPTPVDMSEYEDLVDGAHTQYVAPGTWALIDENCPGLQLNSRAAGVAAAVQSCPIEVHYSDDPDALVLRLAGDNRLERWTPAGGWRAYVPSGSDIYLLPQTALSADANAGDTVLKIHDFEALGLSPEGNDWFAPGQVLVINPGGENEENAVVAGLGSIILEDPLEHDHVAGELVVVAPGLQPSTTLTTTTTLELGTAPVRPEILSVTASESHPMSEFELEMSPMDDADEAGPPTALQVVITGPVNGAPGTVYSAKLPVENPQRLRLPPALLDTETEYAIRACYYDSQGLPSEFSDAYDFATDDVDSEDLDGDGIEDDAEVTGFHDLNLNGKDDSMDPLTVFADGELDEPFAIFSGPSQLKKLKALSELDVAMSAGTSPLLPPLPRGMAAIRLDNLAPIGRAVNVTYYLETGAFGVDGVVNYDPNRGFLDLTSRTSFLAHWVTVNQVDGDAGDLDGVVNGRIVSTCGVTQLGTEVDVACAAPLTGSQTKPSASDCLFILRTAVGSATCNPACMCAPKGTLPATASDALMCLRSAVGVAGIVLNCPCE